jgi:LacI family transcriptional regulator
MDALFLASGGDFLFDAFHVLQDRGLVMPDFGLGVFDDYSFLDILTPRITAIAQPLTLAGETSVDLLLRIIREAPESNQIIQLPTTLIARGSCGEGNRLP